MVSDRRGNMGCGGVWSRPGQAGLRGALEHLRSCSRRPPRKPRPLSLLGAMPHPPATNLTSTSANGRVHDFNPEEPERRMIRVVP